MIKKYKSKFEESSLDVEKAIIDYVKRVQETSNDYFKKNLKRSWEAGHYTKYTYKKGRKFYKIVSEDSIFAFVDAITGDIYKPAGYNTPAKGIIGNIFDDNPPLRL